MEEWNSWIKFNRFIFFVEVVESVFERELELLRLAK